MCHCYENKIRSNVHFLFILNTHVSESILISVKTHPSFRTVSPWFSALTHTKILKLSTILDSKGT